MPRFIKAFLLWLGLLLVTGCVSGHRRWTTASCCATPDSTDASSEQSLFEFNADWKTDGGRQIRLSDLQGRPVIVTMFYTSCHLACPVTLARLKEIESALTADVRSKLTFALITLDPAGDTPRVLHAFRKTQQLPATWFLLRGTDEMTRQVAAKLGIVFEKEGYRLVHSNEIVLLDTDGRIISRLSGLHTSLQAFVQSATFAVRPPG